MIMTFHDVVCRGGITPAVFGQNKREIIKYIYQTHVLFMERNLVWPCLISTTISFPILAGGELWMGTAFSKPLYPYLAPLVLGCTKVEAHNAYWFACCGKEDLNPQP